MRKMNSGVLVAGVMAAGLVGLGGCATKGFVREQVSVVDTRVNGVESTVTQQGTQLAELDKTSREALERATAAGKLAEGKFLFQQVLSDDGVKFSSGKWQLTPEGEARLNELTERLKAENRNVYLEIQGHADAAGSSDYNLKLGEERAEATRRFLAQHGIALNRMATISYGEEAPIADNKTREGRAQNRRVVIVVLA